MTHDKFTGVCFGGPRHGQQLIHSAPIFKVPMISKANLYQSRDVTPDKAIAFESFEYHHVVGLRGEISIDFWLPQGKKASWAINHMFGCYLSNPDSPRPTE